MKCDNCNNDFNYLSRLKSFWLGYKNIRCEQCGAIFEHKMFNRILGALNIGLSLLISNIIFEDKNILYTIIGFISIAILLSLISPFIMKFNRI